MRPQYLAKTVTGNQSICLDRRNRHSIPIKRYATHHIARSRVPRVILPESEESLSSETPADKLQSSGSLLHRDVVKNAIAEHQIERLLFNKIVYAREACARVIDSLGCSLHRFVGDIGPDNTLDAAH